MLRISWQTLRARRATLAGAFVAIFLAVTLAYATGLLMAGALSSPGPGRLGAADVVVRGDPAVVIGHGEDAETVDVMPAPRLPASAVVRAAGTPGVARAVGDVTFPAGAFDREGHPVHAAGADEIRGHGWQSAALTPYELRGGRAPAGPHDVVADARLGVPVGSALRIVTPAGEATYRVSGVAAGTGDRGQAALFFTAAAAQVLSGTPDRVNAIGVFADRGTSPEQLRTRLRGRLGAGVDVLDRSRAAEADAGDRNVAGRASLVGIFGAMGGIAGLVALFVVAGTFGLAIAQRRRETAVLRALGATPRQVRRLISGEALIVSLLASGLGVLAGAPLASTIARVVVDHGGAPQGFAPGHSLVPLAAALGIGIGMAQLAVAAAARRAGRIPPAEALREVAIEHARPGVVRVLSGLLFLAGGATMALVFAGEAASSFAILGAMMSATGVALLGRWLLGVPVAVIAWPLRRLGAAGLLASTGLAANRWRSAALATPIVLIAMLVATQGVLQASDQRNTERATAERVTADHVVTGRDGAPLPAGAVNELSRLPGVTAATATLPTEVFLLGPGLDGWDTPWEAAGADVAGAARTLDLGVVRGDLRAVRGNAVAISRVVASEGHVGVGDVIHARMADTRVASLRVAAIYERAAGLGHVVLDPAVARSHAGSRTAGAVFVAGAPQAGRSLAGYADAHPGVMALDRAEYLSSVHVVLNNEGSWGVWLIIGMSLAFAALALVNTAAMATSERRHELATIRLLGGTPGQAMRMIALELVPTVLVALVAGGAIAAVAVSGVPDGVRGMPLAVPVAITAGLLGGAAILALAAGAVTARFALRASPAAAMRAQE